MTVMHAACRLHAGRRRLDASHMHGVDAENVHVFCTTGCTQYAGCISPVVAGCIRSYAACMHP